MRLAWGTVESLDRDVPGLQLLTVAMDDGRRGSALAYPALSGECTIGDRLLLNTTAVDLELGTGGNYLVVARLGTGEGEAVSAESGGHVMKMRYTPLQIDVLAIESPESAHHSLMRSATDVSGMPVVCCGLHSQVPLVAAGVKRARPDARIAYCMTDQAALPLALSNNVSAAVDKGLLDATITCGQAFGGQLEAVNLHSGILAARHVVSADVAIAAIGPGVVGTSTPFGHGGVAQGEAINAAAAVGGVPVACLRLSSADSRERHRVVSHHTITALSAVALAPAKVAMPTLPSDFSDAIVEALTSARVWNRHERVDSAEGSVPAPSSRGIDVRTMGRGYDEDLPFFAAAHAAGEIASRYRPSVLK